MHLDPDPLRADLCARIRRRHPDLLAPIDDDATLLGLGLDSAEVLEVVADLEDDLQIVVPLDELDRVRTLGELVGLVRRRMAA